jgi:hypothetical protein
MSPIWDVHQNEDGEFQVMRIGQRYLIGNYIVMEYSDSLRAASAFGELDNIDREVIR